jgi:hypothetical protein
VYKRQFLFGIENMRKNVVYYVYSLSNCFRVCFSFCKDLQKEKNTAKYVGRPSDFVRYPVINVNTESLDSRWVDHKFYHVITDDTWSLEGTNISRDYKFKKNWS